MIRQQTILIAQPIVADMVAKGESLFHSVGAIPKALNDVSYGALPYEPETAPLTIPEITSATTDHGDVMDAMSDRISDGVRTAFKQISLYLKPLSMDITQRVESCLDYDVSVPNLIFNRLSIKHLRLDQAFFDSPLYPSESGNNMMDYRLIEKSSLKFPGVIGELDYDQTREYLAVKNDTILQVLEEGNASNAFNTVVVNNLWERFFRDNGSMVDFTSFDIAKHDPAELFSLFVLVTKMKADSNPIWAATNVRLEDYDAWVSHIYHCLCAALVAMRQQYRLVAASNFPVLESNVKVDNTILKGSRVLTGNITVGCTAKSIAAFVEAIAGKDVSISEVVLGRAYLKLLGVPAGVDRVEGVPDIITNVDYFASVYASYSNSLKAAMGDRVEMSVRQAVEVSLNQFQSKHPEFESTVRSLNNDLDYRRLYTAVRQDVESMVQGLIHSCVRNQVSLSAFLAGSPLITQVGHTLGLTMASEILSETRVQAAGELSDVQQRENLTEAVVRVVTRLVVGSIR